MDDQKKRASCDGGGGGTAGASMRCKTEATNEITPVPQKTTANDLKSPPSNLTVDGPPESDKSAGTLKDEPSSKSPSDNVKDVPPEADKSLSDVDTIFFSGIIAMADAARKLHPEETDKVNKLQELCANCVHNYNIKEGGLGGGGDGESGCGVVNNNKVCGQCGGRSYGGPHDNDLDPMDRVFNYHKYDPASYDPNSGVSVEVHSLQYACGKFAEIQYIGKIAPRYGETATENDKDWDKSYPFQGDPNAENPEPIQPFNANEITSDNIQNVADMLRGTVVVCKCYERDDSLVYVSIVSKSYSSIRYSLAMFR
jgi:ribosomal protein S27AE